MPADDALSAETVAEIEEALDRALLYEDEDRVAAVRSQLEVLAVRLWHALQPTIDELVDLLRAAFRVLADALVPVAKAMTDFLDAAAARPPAVVYHPRPAPRPAHTRPPRQPPRPNPRAYRRQAR